MRLVLDASVALAAVLPDEASTYAAAAVAYAVRNGLVVPALWPYEVQNGLLTALRRKRIDDLSLRDALAAIAVLAVELETPRKLGHESALARSHRLTAYDAAYLAVAQRTGSRLATLDRPLREAASASGVELFEGA